MKSYIEFTLINYQPYKNIKNNMFIRKTPNQFSLKRANKFERPCPF